jgi:hypothetical protein
MTVRAIASVGVAALVVVLASCDGELRFDEPVIEGGTPPPAPPPPPIASDGGDASTGDGAGDGSTKRCASDPDCVLATLHCDAVAGACVPCTNDTHCTSSDAKRCDTALHRCVGCGNDGDCGGIKKCEPTTHRCVSPCTTITECITAEAPLCDTTKGFCTRCTASNNVCVFTSDTRLCDQAGYCVGCMSDADCSGKTPRCDFSLNKCVACTASTDCPGAAQCDPTTGTCVGG